MKEIERYKWKRGDIHPITGLVFWHYGSKKDIKGRWVTQEKFKADKERVKGYIKKIKQDPILYAKRKAYEKDYYFRKKDHILKLSKDYYYNNIEKIRVTKNRYKRVKMGDPIFALKCRLRVRIRKMLKTKNYRASAEVYKELGCDKPTLMKWFEQYFNEEMNWDTFKDWHIDHIIPLATAKNEEDLIRLCHYTNLQPLMAKDNMKKGIKII